jgi:hypothetical protein
MFASPLWSSPMIEWSLHSPPCPDRCDVYCRLEAGREWMEVARVCNQSSTADTKLSTNLPSSARQKKTEKSLPQGLHFTLLSETTVWNSRTRRCWTHTLPLKPSLKKHTLVLQSAASLGKMWNSPTPTKYGLLVATTRSSLLQISHQRLGEWSKTPRKSRRCPVLFSGLARIETSVSRFTILLSLEHGNNSRKSSKPKPFWQQQNSKTPKTQFFFQSSSCTIYTHKKNNNNFNPSITITTETTTNLLLLLQMKANM